MDRARLDQLFLRLGALDAIGAAALFAEEAVLRIGADPAVKGRIAIAAALREHLSTLDGMVQRVLAVWEIPGGFVRQAEVEYRLRAGGEACVPELALIRARGDRVDDLRIYRDGAHLLAALQAARPDEVTVRHEERGVQGAFFVVQDGRRVGELAYTLAGPNLMVIDHTEVGPELRGRAAGQRLVEATVRYARSSGRRLLPLCPFARALLDRSGQMQDVVAPHA
jgi:predicted GNAT family acetyltransferase